MKANRTPVKITKGGKGFTNFINQIRSDVRDFDEAQRTDDLIFDIAVKMIGIYGIDWYYDMFSNDTDLMNDIIKTVKKGL